jgi:mono/diheme cytochrome c family protein
MTFRKQLVTACLMALVAVPTSIALAKRSDWRVPAIAARTRNPVPADAEALRAGRELWAKQCASCHGTAGRADGPEAKKLDKAVPDLGDPELLPRQTDGEIFRKITVGRRPMPGYRTTLTDRQRWQLVHHMRTIPRSR